eukprot:1153119-Pelagomonas_calceolata.AAC.17
MHPFTPPASDWSITLLKLLPAWLLMLPSNSSRSATPGSYVAAANSAGGAGLGSCTFRGSFVPAFRRNNAADLNSQPVQVWGSVTHAKGEKQTFDAYSTKGTPEHMSASDGWMDVHVMCKVWVFRVRTGKWRGKHG